MTQSQTGGNTPGSGDGDAGFIEVVAVGGMDPGGGAGLLRDVATARARGALARAVGTAWTEQGPGIHELEPRSPATVARGLRLALAGRPGAIKIGMAVGPATAAAILEALEGCALPVVVDPVLASSRGGALWGAHPADQLPLVRRATLATPNAGEAAALTGLPVTTVEEAEAAARKLVAGGARAVLVKGGHLGGGDGAVTDVMVTADGGFRFSRPRTPGPTPRGTGCALATAIAVELARGAPLEAAVRIAGDWLAAAIRAATTRGDERRL